MNDLETVRERGKLPNDVLHLVVDGDIVGVHQSDGLSEFLAHAQGMRQACGSVQIHLITNGKHVGAAGSDLHGASDGAAGTTQTRKR